jgi:glucose/arabinose dehydrogenase
MIGRGLAAAFALTLVATACSSGGGETTREPDATSVPLSDGATTTPAIPANLAAVSMRVEKLSTYAFVEPTAVVDRTGDDRMWIVERKGHVTTVKGGGADRMLDISSEISTNGERGLLGIDFSPDGHWLYLSFTDTDGNNRVVEYEMGDDGRPVEASRRDVISEPHPFTAHHGGGIVTGPDGMLYIGWGDGEAPTEHKDNAQSLGSPLGKVLRIQPKPEGGYEVPADNPFVAQADARPEIYALGLRNPWRFSFDRETGDAYIGDVGQYSDEEISFVPAAEFAGANFGWPFLEGTEPQQGVAPDGLVAPIVSWTHDDGRCAAVGGFVYRGSAIPALRGSYVYGDLCDSRVHAIRIEHGRIVDERDFGQFVTEGLVGFGEDGQGELYILSLPFGVFKLVPA